MDYYDQLKTKEWFSKRESILERDGNRCQNCQNISFEAELKSGIILIPYYNRITNNRIYNIFQNLNFEPEGYLPTQIIITKELLTRKFDNNPKILWIDYKRTPNSQVADIYFIKTLNTECRIEISRLQNLNRIHSIESEFREIDLVNQYGACGAILEETRSLNPYYNEELLRMGKQLPICFSFCLNVHHKVYRISKLAWEYHDDDLITLCWKCHEELHRNTKIKCFGFDNEFIEELTPCSRCYGAGWFERYRHVENGVCFRCRGARFEELIKSANN